MRIITVRYSASRPLPVSGDMLREMKAPRCFSFPFSRLCSDVFTMLLDACLRQDAMMIGLACVGAEKRCPHREACDLSG